MNNSQDQEFEKYIQELEDPNYQGGSRALSLNPTPLEKSKYELCKKMIIYKRENKLSTEEVAKRIKLSSAETNDILHYRTNYFTLDRLMDYVSKLFSTFDIQITITEKEKRAHL